MPGSYLRYSFISNSEVIDDAEGGRQDSARDAAGQAVECYPGPGRVVAPDIDNICDERKDPERNRKRNEHGVNGMTHYAGGAAHDSKIPPSVYLKLSLQSK